MKYIFYSLISWFIHSYKYLELKLFELFSNKVEQRVQNAFAKVGINFHFDDEKSPMNSSDKMKNKWDIQVHDRRFFTQFANTGPLGLGEAYMDKYWDCEDIPQACNRFMRGKVYLEYFHPWNRFLNYLQLSFFNLQPSEKAWEVGQKHYDLGNDLFESFLDPWMTYSCGYWANADNLNDAQIHKMDLIAAKLQLKPGMKVLDIGCGWGGLCKYLAEKHGVECIGITISVEGIKYGKEICKGLPVEFRLMDYRDLNEKFDRIVSIGMYEHVGPYNSKTYFEVANRCLKDNGIFLLHTIGQNHHDLPRIDSFCHTYIFPNGSIPYYKDITKDTEGLFIIEDWHNFGHDYSKTLAAWKENFVRNWPKIEHKYGDRFYRLWSYYLDSCTGYFKARKLQLWQIVLSKNGLEGGYRSIR